MSDQVVEESKDISPENAEALDIPIAEEPSPVGEETPVFEVIPVEEIGVVDPIPAAEAPVPDEVPAEHHEIAEPVLTDEETPAVSSVDESLAPEVLSIAEDSTAEVVEESLALSSPVLVEEPEVPAPALAEVSVIEDSDPIAEEVVSLQGTVPAAAADEDVAPALGLIVEDIALEEPTPVIEDAPIPTEDEPSAIEPPVASEIVGPESAAPTVEPATPDAIVDTAPEEIAQAPAPTENGHIDDQSAVDEVAPDSAADEVHVESSTVEASVVEGAWCSPKDLDAILNLCLYQVPEGITVSEDATETVGAAQAVVAEPEAREPVEGEFS